MTPPDILHEAEIELRDAIAYYEAKCPGLGLDFESEVEHSVDVIKRFPKLCPLREDGTRRYLMHRFPYVIVYTYIKISIWIISIAHCKRRPGYWKDRITTVRL